MTNSLGESCGEAQPMYLQARIPRSWFNDCDGSETTIGAAAYMAWLAYPAECEARKRRKFVDAMLAWIVKRNWGRSGGRPPSADADYAPGSIIEALDRSGRENMRRLRGWDARALGRTLDPALDRVNTRRLPAAKIALQRLGGHSLRLALGELDFPAEEAAPGTIAEALEGPGQHNRDNLRRLVWRESRPALAMTLALLPELQRIDRPQNPRSNEALFKFMLRDDWVTPAIERAQDIAPRLANALHLPVILVPRR